jgi:hypothetical protein
MEQTPKMRNGEYEGYLGVVAESRRMLTEHLASWFAGDRTELRAGMVLGQAELLGRLRYGRGTSDEIEKARPGAHRINRRQGLACSCGTIRACPTEPTPDEIYLESADDYWDGEEFED